MKWKNILNFNNIRMFVSSILISLFMILLFNGGYLPNIPTPFERELVWLNFALPIIFIVALLNSGKTLENAIKKGAIIGILGWLFFFIYYYIECFISPDFWQWGLFWAFFIFIFLPLLIISSIIGLVISYYIRRHLEKRKRTLQ